MTANQQVYVGQQVALTANPQPPDGVSVTNTTWTIQGTAIQNYAASASSGSVTPPPSTITGTGVTFYWVDTTGCSGSSCTATFWFGLSNGQSGCSVATFSVSGPTGANVTPQIGSVQVDREPDPKNPNVLYPSLILLGVTDPPIPPGMEAGVEFAATASPPVGNTGAFQWVQLVNGDDLNLLDASGRGPCTGGPPAGSPELDTTYPYPYILTSSGSSIPNNAATDNPAFFMTSQGWGEGARNFNATMYLMWIPEADGHCTSTTAPCAIPVPLGFLQGWGFSGDTINTLTPLPNDTTWMLSCGRGQPTPTFTPSSSYPVWGAPSPYTGAQSCQ